MNYNVDYFIEKFEAIPENLWAIGTRSNGSARCALGWCYDSTENALKSSFLEIEDSEEEIALHKLIKYLSKENKVFFVASINNGRCEDYQQPTPKQRILAALFDIKANEAVNEVEEILSHPIEPKNDLHTDKSILSKQLQPI